MNTPPGLFYSITLLIFRQGDVGMRCRAGVLENRITFATHLYWGKGGVDNTGEDTLHSDGKLIGVLLSQAKDSFDFKGAL